jgi:hypothetical protein
MTQVRPSRSAASALGAVPEKCSDASLRKSASQCSLACPASGISAVTVPWAAVTFDIRGAINVRHRCQPPSRRPGWLSYEGTVRIGPRLTATAAATGYQQRPATAHNSRTIRANLGYVRPEKQTVEDQRRSAATVAKTAAKPLNNTPTHVDNSGISVQPTTGDGRPWTACPLLRIR